MNESNEIAVGLIWFGSSLVVGPRPQGAVLEGHDEFPGGKILPGESPAEAVKRECFEETGLEVSRANVRLETTHEYPQGTVHLFFCDCQLDTEAKTPPPLKAPFRWATLEEVFQLRFPEGNGAILESLRATPQPFRTLA